MFARFVGHAVATTLVIATALLATVALYVGLLGWAVVADEPLGGPLALPFLLFLALAGSAVSVLVVLLPATLASEDLCRRRSWSSWTRIPVAALLSFVLAVAMGTVGGVWADAAGRGAAVGALWGAVLLAPLVLYGAVEQIAAWLAGTAFRVLGRAWRRVSTRATAASTATFLPARED